MAATGAVILLTGGWYWLDPAVSLVISVLIALRAWVLLRETAEVLLEATPSGLDLDGLARTMTDVPGVEAVHDVHVWTLSSDVRALSAHVVLDGHPTLEEAQVVGEHVKATVGPAFHIAHATLELECEACDDEENWCAIDRRATVPDRDGDHERRERPIHELVRRCRSGRRGARRTAVDRRGVAADRAVSAAR